MKRHALFVGVDTYVDPTIQDLRYPSEDAAELSSVFRRLLKFDRVEKLINPDHSPAVVDAIKDLARGLGPGDLFLVFFAGHGFRVGEDHVLVCAKDEFADLEDRYAGLPVGQLKKRMNGPWNRMLVLDACQNDIRTTRGADAGVTGRDLDLIHAPEVSGSDSGCQIVVSACSEGQRALEVSELGHGLFTSALLDSVTAFADARQRIDLERLRTDLGNRMGGLISKYRLSGRQEPLFTMPANAAGVVLLDGVAPAAAPPVPPPVVPKPPFVRVSEPGPEDTVPFDFEWNGSSTIADGSAGRVSFRLRARCNLAKVGVALASSSSAPIVFEGLCEDEAREGAFEVAPDEFLPSALRVEAAFGSRIRERFRADPATTAEPDDEGFRPVRFLPEALRHEAVRLRAQDAALDELLVLPGSDLLRFGGRSSRRNDVILDGAPLVVSRGQFSLLLDRARGEVLLRDGVPDAGKPGSWIPSAHGVSVYGGPLLSPLPLAPNRRYALSLAPRAMPADPLRLSFETTGWDVPAAADWPFRDGPLSSLLVRREDAPRRPILVVWGAAALDPVLGTSSGLRVVSFRGRLHLSGSDGRLRRLPFLTGRVLPGTPYVVR